MTSKTNPVGTANIAGRTPQGELISRVFSGTIPEITRQMRTLGLTKTTILFNPRQH